MGFIIKQDRKFEINLPNNNEKKNLKNEVGAIWLTNRDKDYIPPVLSVED